MSDESTRPQGGRARGFIEFLRGLAAREDRGALAALRRSLQDPSGIAMSACPYVVPFLAPEPNRTVERSYFLIGGLFALHPEHQDGVSLGHVFRQINEQGSGGSGAEDNESTRARFVALLDADAADVGEHLRHAVSLARARECAIDWTRLLTDLLRWAAEDRSVQRRLARDFWATDGTEKARADQSTVSTPSTQESEKHP